MSGTLRDIALVMVFILVGSFFVVAEMALVSLRDSQAKALQGTCPNDLFRARRDRRQAQR